MCRLPHAQIHHWEFVLRSPSEERDSNSALSTQPLYLFIWLFFLFIHADNIPGLFWCLKPRPRLLVRAPRPFVCTYQIKLAKCACEWLLVLCIFLEDR